jgi:2-dehydro-3-deoxy-L-rhamnonate dehydrogenase (NAD+)
MQLGQLLSGRVVMVTGATSGIGLAIARAFMGEATGLVLFARGVPDTQPPSDNVLSVRGTVSSPVDVAQLMEATLLRFGRIDVLVNCAGISPTGRFMETPFEEWQAGIDTNLLGYARMCRAVLPHMMKSGYGRIINMGSRAAENINPGKSAYSISKAGAHIFTRYLAAEIDRTCYPNILINDLIPGLTNTRMTRQGQEPSAVVPFVRKLIALPSGGPSGVAFFKGEPYRLFADGNPTGN